MDSYEDEFTGENINCVATTTTSVAGKGKVDLIRLAKSLVFHYIDIIELNEEIP